MAIALMYILIILGFDLIFKEKLPLPPQYLKREGRVSEISLKEREDRKDCLITVRSVGSPYHKLLLYLDQSLINKLFQNGESRLHIGDKIEFEGRFQEFLVARNEGGFQAKAYYENEGYKGSVRTRNIKILSEPSAVRLLYVLPNLLHRLREKLSNNFRLILGEREAGTLSAMILGDKSFLDPEVKEAYADHAISHLLAISGLHISMIGLLLYLLCKKLKFSYFYSNSIPILFLGLYIIFTGFSVSATRAGIMMILYFLARLFRRTYDLPSALAFSALLLLSLNYRLLYQGSFQLSFMAVIAIFFALRLTETIFMKEKKRWFSYVITSVLNTVTITLFMLPLLLWHFYEVSLNGLFLNVIVIPLMAILVAMGLVGGLFSLPSILLGRFFLGSVDFILRFYDFLLDFAKINRWNKLVFGRPSLLACFFYYTVLFIGFGLLHRLTFKENLLFLKGTIGRGEKEETRSIKKIFVGFVLLLCFLPLFLKRKEDFDKRLNLGEGRSRIVRTKEGEVFLLDCGSKEVKEMGKREVLPFLKYHGISKVEGVYLSAFLEERAGGISYLLDKEELRIKKLILPQGRSLRNESERLKKVILRKAEEKGIKIFYLNDEELREEGREKFVFIFDEKRGDRRIERVEEK